MVKSKTVTFFLDLLHHSNQYVVTVLDTQYDTTYQQNG